MAAENSPPQAGNTTLEGGNYDIIAARLSKHARELASRAETLNTRRKQLFGTSAMGLIATTRVRTENNCVPRDIAQVGGQLLFGYNVFLGLRNQIRVEDVFSLQRMEVTDAGVDFHPLAHEGTFLADPAFVREFAELYQYYRDTRLIQLRRLENRLFMVFQTSPTAVDLRIFRWAIDTRGQVSYIDNRGDREFVVPPTHDFEWIRTTREQQVRGRFPHINVLDTIFVETTGGDLTIKVENNTEDGAGIYSEAVEDRHQGLDDAEIFYAQVGQLILLKIRPYREQVTRYLVFNTRSQQVIRLDDIGLACQRLPEDHGIIFPGGYCLQDGTHKTFPGDVSQMSFKRMVRAPNGEDVLYVFHERISGRYALLPYNLIAKEVVNPLFCHGYGRFDDGRLVVFRAENNEPTRVHPMQVWQTPYMSDDHAAAQPSDGSFLGRVGNAELVRGISDVLGIRRLVLEQTPTSQRYADLIKSTTRIVDHYHWLGHGDAADLLSPLKEILASAELILDEFEKVESIRKRSREALAGASQDLKVCLDNLRPESWTTASEFVDALGKLKGLRGHLISLRELRYIDLASVDDLEGKTVAGLDQVSEATTRFLLKPEALSPYATLARDAQTQVERVVKTPELVPIRDALEAQATGLGLLTEVASALKIDDPEARARILDEISEVFGLVNRARATLDARRKQLLSSESVAQFGAEFKLFSQSVGAGLSQADTPEKCDDLLSRLMVQLTQLEARYGELDQFVAELASKREEVFDAFEARKQSLLEERGRRAQALIGAADRILKGVLKRAQGFTSQDELNTWFASDVMVLKVQDIVTQLLSLGDAVRADELRSRLKASREEAIRGLRDKHDLFEDGQAIIKLGRHRFAVNTQPVELTLLQREGGLCLHLSGTEFFEPITDVRAEGFRSYWDQSLVSESEHVYRGEYLALCMLFDAEAGRGGVSLNQLLPLADREGELLAEVRRYATDLYDQGYERGIHDADATRILGALLKLWTQAGLLRYSSAVRAWAALFWGGAGADEQRRTWWRQRALSLGYLRTTLGQGAALEALGRELGQAIVAYLQGVGFEVDTHTCSLSGEYLAEELSRPTLQFVSSRAAARLRTALLHRLDLAGTRESFLADVKLVGGDPRAGFELCQLWLKGLVEVDTDLVHEGSAVDETAAWFLTETLPRAEVGAETHLVVSGLLGGHTRIRDQKLSLQLDEVVARLSHFRRVHVPAFQAWRQLRTTLVDEARVRLRLDEFKPKVLTSFVRNRLINEVYLPLIGDNLAKQMGAVGPSKRTDLMGILLLISPPGYGKTTLMEYVASRLGLVFMKINGPALGHDVTSIDPAEAPNATARQEVEKINLALEMGSNVMLYLDDIQHTNPELLQKFISLCDAQRRIEGVWRGRSRTYDMRGKKFCVVMAGNPYTESGSRFQIPDMLANRADTYNLGDILDGKDDLFALSYLENALTSNPALQPLSSREPGDVHKLIRMAGGEQIPATDLSFAYSAAEILEITEVFKKMIAVQQVLLKVNKTYILSASMDDSYRMEPPFKLQGSYRNMSKVSEKLRSAMTDAEVERIIDDHYQGEAQNLTTGAEQNLLKLAEMRGRLSDVQKHRWEEIKKGFAQQKLSGGKDGDPVARLMTPLAALVTEVQSVADVLSRSDPGDIPRAMGELGVRLDALKRVFDEVDTTAIPRELATLREELGSQDKAAISREIDKLGIRVEGVLTPVGTGEVVKELAGLRGLLVEVMPALMKHLDLLARIQYAEWKRSSAPSHRRPPRPG